MTVPKHILIPNSVCICKILKPESEETENSKFSSHVPFQYQGMLKRLGEEEIPLATFCQHTFVQEAWEPLKPPKLQD
ncbi:hypothetical protein TNCT_731431 [Trichonephila clavata]|uniref:Uncharacterized protein n=1 Tax=Trichonephila clavata TaxID=2740835 RepID=A0A8X6I1E2_TRICU|nr:hypothetical protein TNCT_731431 [Trichonephila clavata]